MLGAQQVVARQRPLLRLDPAVVRDATGVRFSKVGVWLEPGRVRVFGDSRPEPSLLLDLPVVDVDLDLGRRRRDRVVQVTLADGSVLLVTALPGACACTGAGMFRGWTPPP